MLSYTLWLVAVSVSVAVSLRIVSVRWHRKELFRRTGCQEIPKYPNSLALRYDREYSKAYHNGRINDFAMHQYKRCGSSTYKLHTMNQNVIFTMHPANHQVIATQLNDWVKEDRRGCMHFFGTNILNQNGSAWRRTRDLVSPLFRVAELKSIEHFQKFVDRLMHHIPRDGSTIDMQPLLRKLFLDSSTEFIFGESIDSLRDTSSKSNEFIAAFNRASAGAGKRWLPTGFRQRLANTLDFWDHQWKADCKSVHDYIDGCIERHRERAKSGSAENSRRYVLIEGMSEQISDPITLRFHLMGIFNNARETAAVAFGNVLFMLARNPHVWADLRKQTLSQYPRNAAAITYELLKGMSAFRHVVLETFRLHSPVTRNRALAARDTVLPTGGGPNGLSPAYVPRGSRVYVDKYPLSRDPQFWGKDVEEFRPSRFKGKRLGWEFSPFSGGPRICPANQQVILQCMYLLFRFVREFETIENRDPCLEYMEFVMMCFESKNGYQVALHPVAPAGR